MSAALATLLLLWSPPPPAVPPPSRVPAAEEAAGHEFRARLDAYVALRLELEKQVPAAAVQTDVRLLQERGSTLAEAVRRARSAVRQGDLFVPAVRPLLLRVIADELRNDAAARSALLDGDPVREGRARVRLAVNASYPEPAPWSTVPPALLSRLPTLPDDLEYHFAGRTLLLVDTRARLLLDFLPGAVPR